MYTLIYVFFDMGKSFKAGFQDFLCSMKQDKI